MRQLITAAARGMRDSYLIPRDMVCSFGLLTVNSYLLGKGMELCGDPLMDGLRTDYGLHTGLQRTLHGQIRTPGGLHTGGKRT